VAPTILWLLGIRPTSPMDGRVLTEALEGRAGGETAKPEETLMEAACEANGTKWRQHLRQVKFQNVPYFIEGNGKQVTE
jgi:hypothetical protein